jgi:hypothetical protein
MKEHESSAAAPVPSHGLSFRVMQMEAIRLINLSCVNKSIRGSRDLSIRAGIPEDRTRLVYRAPGTPLPADSEPIILNGKEWDALLSAVEVPLEMWINKCQEKHAAPVDENDKVVSLAPQFGASADGCEPPAETQQRIETILGYSVAFFLKASNIILPKAPVHA